MLGVIENVYMQTSEEPLCEAEECHVRSYKRPANCKEVLPTHRQAV